MDICGRNHLQKLHSNYHFPPVEDVIEKRRLSNTRKIVNELIRSQWMRNITIKLSYP